MAHISRGSGTPTAHGWAIVSVSAPARTAQTTSGETIGLADLDDVDRGEVWFRAERQPGIRVRLAILLDGTVVSFEVHVEGSTERAHPLPELDMPPMADVSIGTRLVRRIPVQELADMARAAIRAKVEQAETWTVANSSIRWPELASQAAALRQQAKRPGRRGNPEAFYAALAVAYEAWLDTPERPPLAELAEREHLTTSGLRAALNVARNKGFLTEAPKGRAGGRATEKARSLVERSVTHDDEEE